VDVAGCLSANKFSPAHPLLAERPPRRAAYNAGGFTAQDDTAIDTSLGYF
jgi:hypothetical protein